MSTKVELRAMSPTEHLCNLHEHEGCNVYCQDGAHATVVWWVKPDRPDLIRARFVNDYPSLDLVDVKPATEAPPPSTPFGQFSNGQEGIYSYPQYQYAYLILFQAPNEQDS